MDLMPRFRVGGVHDHPVYEVVSGDGSAQDTWSPSGLMVVRALNACERIAAIHKRNADDECPTCDTNWPCATRRIADEGRV